MASGASVQHPQPDVATARDLASRLSLATRRVPLVLQGEATECGLACLAMVAGAHGHRIDLASLRRRFPPSIRGVTMRQILASANALDLSGRALRIDVGQLRSLRTPCILHWDLTHFVVLVRAKGDRFVIHDPASGRRVYRAHEMSAHFTGVALELSPSQTFEPRVEERRLRLYDLWTRIHGMAGSVATIVVLSLLLQLVLLAAPFYTQMIVDDVLVKQDRGLLLALGVGFALILLIRTGIASLRQYAVLYMGSLLSFQISANLLGHLIRLPLAYFERRHLGDVLSRFRSSAPIEQLLTTGFVSAAIDGVVAVASLAMMFVYSVTLGAITLGAAVVFTFVRVALYRPLRQLREEAIVAESREETLLIESLRGIQTLKLVGGESQREALWQNRRTDTLNANVRTGRLQILYTALHTLTFGVENLIVIYAAAQLALEGAFTVGMLYAYIAYKGQFAGRISELVEWAIQYRMLDVHLGRLADIVHTEEESGLRGAPVLARELRGRLEMRNVSFRYAPTEPFVLRDVSLTIEAGSQVAIVGPSGSGKTTFLKLLLGLLEPTEGEILVDGRPLRAEGAAWYRSQLATVMQSDALFEGTVADNICAFDPEADRDRVEAAARAAELHDEILRMPMGYQSLLNNMGSNLSGGQRQRLLLARALYRGPRLLLLDEGTANLDDALVDRIRRTLASLPITRVIVSHQRALRTDASRVFVLEDAHVVEEARAEARAHA